MNMHGSCRGQKGVALMVVLAILIVVSLGILAMSNGAVNMRRSSIGFGHANEAYNAASAGLSVARGYLKGLTYDQDLSDGDKEFDGALGAASYDLSIDLHGGYTPTATPIQEPQYDQNGNAIPGAFIRKWIKTYTISSTGNSAPAKRVLRYSVRVTKTELISEHSTYDPKYDVLAGGNLNLSGQADFGTVHTNSDFDGTGNAGVVVGSCSGTADTSGNFHGTIFNAPQVEIPVPNIEALTGEGAEATVYHHVGTLSLSGTGDGGLAALIDADGVAGRKIVYIEGGDLKISGQVQLEGYFFFVDGRAQLSGQSKVLDGLIYAGWSDDSDTAISLSGQTQVTGGIIAAGKIKASGQFEAKLDNLQDLTPWWTFTTTVDETNTTLEEISAIEDI